MKIELHKAPKKLLKRIKERELERLMDKMDAEEVEREFSRVRNWNLKSLGLYPNDFFNKDID